ncbi:aminomethyl-transferring glycine dehydrogenase subunit GcvPA [Romboutsia maritimum]|uniref:Multifunctional fusion protein n=1 Tax=Romboutsia maritimum TaxID=2020948 RepID=A0A371ITI8_9FIRM|nr:aminomethyl-transferring glycine dehydrogenase subunit GcvPA [Romboutsia maritimum]RDY23775.1 aminomethyl-transferring glycine dehydrogenase subunit GcvPA [Romboutsia maritimum]
MSELKRTALYNDHKEAKAKFFEFAGWEMPLEYEGISKEHEAVRNNAGLFDVSHMGEVLIKGDESEKFIQNIITNDITTMKENDVIYTPMCYEDGGVVDDLLVYKLGKDEFLLVVNASNTQKDEKWIKDNSTNYKVDIKDISDKTSQLAIQGPKSEKILQKLTQTKLSNVKFFKLDKDIEICKVPCIVSRTGYTGEDGFEIYCKNEDVLKIWNEILIKGENEIKPIGLGARDTLRFEASLPLYGNEISDKISPLEGGISCFVKLEKENFIGKEALLKQKEDGIKRKLVGFEMLGKGIPRHGYEVKIKDEVIGFVTTGCFSPTLNKTLGLALIDGKYSDLGEEVDIAIRKKVVKAKVIKRPFYNKNYKKDIDKMEIENREYTNNEFSYIPATDEDKYKMLKCIGINSIDDLFSDIPQNLKLNKELNLESSKCEMEVSKKISELANKNINLDKITCFLGAGAYDHYIPSLIKHITSRSEFYTAYTPYQAEISQGTLQVIFEFQSMIADLTDMEIANASMYDGATAATEACIMAVGQTRRKKIVISKTVHPETRKVLQTYMKNKECEIVEVDFCNEYGITDINKLKDNVDKETACVLIQNPNFFGVIEHMQEIEKITHENKAMLIMSVNPISLGILKTPGEIGADIVVGEAQSLGNSLNFGGPYVGFMATKSKLVRKMPGRIVGQSVDSENKRAYVLTLQAREQHVRREKATSNICSNQALNALIASIYMATLGKEGFKEVCCQSMKKAHYAYEELIKTGKLKPVFKGKFFNEFIVSSDLNVEQINSKLLENHILGGYNLENNYKDLKNSMLLCVTEKRSKNEIDKLVGIMEGM